MRETRPEPPRPRPEIETKGVRNRDRNVDEATRLVLDQLSVAAIAEYLFLRLGLVRGELRLTAKDGRYDRGKKVVPLAD